MSMLFWKSHARSERSFLCEAWKHPVNVLSVKCVLTESKCLKMCVFFFFFFFFRISNCLHLMRNAFSLWHFFIEFHDLYWKRSRCRLLHSMSTSHVNALRKKGLEISFRWTKVPATHMLQLISAALCKLVSIHVIYAHFGSCKMYLGQCDGIIVSSSELCCTSNRLSTHSQVSSCSWYVPL